MKLKPGWKMSYDQHASYWHLLDHACKTLGVHGSAQREEVRHRIHRLAFGRYGVSAKEIDHLKMFDAFKAQCLAISAPADLTAQKSQIEMPLARLKHSIRALADEPYITKLVADRFTWAVWLRNTVGTTSTLSPYLRCTKSQAPEWLLRQFEQATVPTATIDDLDEYELEQLRDTARVRSRLPSIALAKEGRSKIKARKADAVSDLIPF